MKELKIGGWTFTKPGGRWLVVGAAKDPIPATIPDSVLDEVYDMTERLKRWETAEGLTELSADIAATKGISPETVAETFRLINDRLVPPDEMGE